MGKKIIKAISYIFLGLIFILLASFTSNYVQYENIKNYESLIEKTYKDAEDNYLNGLNRVRTTFDIKDSEYEKLYYQVVIEEKVGARRNLVEMIISGMPEKPDQELELEILVNVNNIIKENKDDLLLAKNNLNKAKEAAKTLLDGDYREFLKIANFPKLKYGYNNSNDDYLFEKIGNLN